MVIEFFTTMMGKVRTTENKSEIAAVAGAIPVFPQDLITSTIVHFTAATMNEDISRQRVMHSTVQRAERIVQTSRGMEPAFGRFPTTMVHYPF